MDKINDLKIIHEFVIGKTQFLSNSNLCIEGDSTKSRLFSKSKKLLAIIKIVNKTRLALVRHNSEYYEILEQVLQKSSFIPIETQKEGLIAYKQYEIPLGYTWRYTQAVNIWEAWYPRQKQDLKHDSQLDILVFFQEKWHPIKEMSFQQDRLLLKTLYREINLNSQQQVVWICKSHQLIVNKNLNLVTGYYQQSLPVENCSVYPSYSSNSYQTNNSFTDLPAKFTVNQQKLSNVRAQHLEKHTPANLALAQKNFASEVNLSSSESLSNQSLDENVVTPQHSNGDNMNSNLDNSNEYEVYCLNFKRKSTDMVEKSYVLKFSQGNLYIKTAIGEIVVEGSNYQFKINPNRTD